MNLFHDESSDFPGPPTFKYPHRAATISACESYRLNLSRTWRKDKGHVLFVMLNPSTADAFTDDATCEKCMRYARYWGYGGIEIVNLFALRATNPAALRDHPDPVGEGNMDAIRHAAHDPGARVIVCGWGNEAINFGKGHKLNDQWKRVAGMLWGMDLTLHALTITGAGMPGHPLYLAGNLEPLEWTERQL